VKPRDLPAIEFESEQIAKEHSQFVVKADLEKNQAEVKERRRQQLPRESMAKCAKSAGAIFLSESATFSSAWFSFFTPHGAVARACADRRPLRASF
jgi:CMP-N-acetylneuraminic acid synthetase